MKTIKQSVLVLAATFAASVTFAQVGLGVTNSTRASVSKSVNVTGATQAAAHAAANENARVNAQDEVHASEQAKAHANDNSAVFGAKSDGTTSTDADVKVDGG